MAFDIANRYVSSIELKLTSGKEDVTTRRFSETTMMRWQEGMPGIIWFDRNEDRVFEILDYRWDGPRYQEMMIQDNTSDTNTSGGRKGRLAGALIGTMIAPGIGTIIGAAVGTGKKETSNTKGQMISHIETKEVPAAGSMRLRDLSNDMIYNIGFRIDSADDTRIRNGVAANLEPLETAVYIEEADPEPVKMISRREETDDVLARIRELKDLLDDGAISREEYEVLKRKLL